MLLSKSCEYGMRATLYIASLEQEGFVSIRDISERLDLSFHFLTKILQKLTHARILHSFRCPNGGVALENPAERITLEEFILPIHGPEHFIECILSLPSSGEQNACHMH